MFYIVDKNPVFLSDKKYKELYDIALEGKDLMFKGLSMIRGNKECDERETLMRECLIALHNINENRFYKDWLEFELLDEEARNNTWDILNDYCLYYGHSYLSDERSFQQESIDSYMGDNIRYPMGGAFLLNHIVKPRKWWWKYIHRMHNRKVSIVIDTSSVNKIIGNLKHFRVYMNHLILDCGEDFRIYPTWYL